MSFCLSSANPGAVPWCSFHTDYRKSPISDVLLLKRVCHSTAICSPGILFFQPWVTGSEDSWAQFLTLPGTSKCPLQYPHLAAQLSPLHSTPSHSNWYFSFSLYCSPSTPDYFGDLQVIRCVHLLTLIISKAQVISHRTSEVRAKQGIRPGSYSTCPSIFHNSKVNCKINATRLYRGSRGGGCLISTDHITQ